MCRQEFHNQRSWHPSIVIIAIYNVQRVLRKLAQHRGMRLCLGMYSPVYIFSTIRITMRTDHADI